MASGSSPRRIFCAGWLSDGDSTPWGVDAGARRYQSLWFVIRYAWGSVRMRLCGSLVGPVSGSALKRGRSIQAVSVKRKRNWAGGMKREKNKPRSGRTPARNILIEGQLGVRLGL